MSILLLLQGLLPLVVFALVDIFVGFRWAILAAMVCAVGEAALSWYMFHEIDRLTWLSLGLILVMGAVSYYLKSERLFKFQPVIMAAILAATMFYFQIFEQPLTVQMMPKIAPMLPVDRQHLMADSRMIESMGRMDALMIVAFVVHGALVAWSAIYKSTAVWLVMRGVGFYVLMALVILVNALWSKFALV